MLGISPKRLEEVLMLMGCYCYCVPATTKFRRLLARADPGIGSHGPEKCRTREREIRPIGGLREFVRRTAVLAGKTAPPQPLGFRTCGVGAELR